MEQIENNSENDFFKNRKAIIREVKGMRTYEDDPIFKKKLEDAYKALEECPLPEHLLKRLNED
ncbi:MAG TPA: hypothetical protein VGN00_03625 [Puia sp.]|jgi:hypothetical protein